MFALLCVICVGCATSLVLRFSLLPPQLAYWLQLLQRIRLDITAFLPSTNSSPGNQRTRGDSRCL